MIKFIEHGSDIFKTECEAIVNPANCIGVLGGGLAYEIVKRYPEACKLYIDMCKLGLFHPGCTIASKTHDNKWVIHLPTKDKPSNDSSIAFIRFGVRSMVGTMLSRGIGSVAIPALGCGLGNLDWNKIKPVIIEAIGKADSLLEYHLYEPH